MNVELLQRDDVRALTTEAEALLSEASQYKIATAVSYQLAAEDLQRTKGAMKRLEDVRKSITQPMDTAKKAVMDFFRGPAEQLERAEKQIKTAMQNYLADVERKRLEEARRAEEAAQAERERLAIAAADAAESGAIDTATEIAQSVARVIPAPVLREAPKVHGIVTKEVWRFEITDEKQIPREYLIVDEAAIRKVLQALKAKTSIAGIRVWPEEQISSRAS